MMLKNSFFFFFRQHLLMLLTCLVHFARQGLWKIQKVEEVPDPKILKTASWEEDRRCSDYEDFSIERRLTK